MASQFYAGKVTKKLLADLIRTRMPLEVQSVADAVRNATPQDILELRRLLTTAGQNLENDTVLNETNMAFHRRIAVASKNAVLPQLLDVLAELFTNEQRLILDIFGSRERDHREHVGILKAIEARDEKLAVRRMKKHLEGVEAAVLRWDPEKHPVS
jgi:GntR family transcriptional repressor for pyruvate dehydrogenase complex